MPKQQRRWFRLGLRHLRMASRLLRCGFADGAVFHTYHAYECVVSAFLAAKGYSVTPNGRVVRGSSKRRRGSTKSSHSSTNPQTSQSPHKQRLLLFNQLADRTKPYFHVHTILSRMVTPNHRNSALYYDPQQDRLPHQVFDVQFALDLIPEVRQFARHVWKDIK